MSRDTLTIERMTEPARRLLKALAGKGRCAADELGMTQVDLRRAIDDLGHQVDDDHREVVVVKAWRAEDHIVAVELTETGRGLAYWA